MSNHTVRCDQKGCDFTYAHPNQSVANRVMGNHKRRQHGIIGASQSAQWKAKNERIVAKHGIEDTSVREPERLKQTAPEPMVVPNFCPNCGCSIRTIMAAMNLKAKR